MPPTPMPNAAGFWSSTPPTRFVKLLEEVHRYPLAALRAGPLHKK